MSSMGHQAFNPLEAQIHMTMDRLSNKEAVHIEEQWIVDAGEEFKAALRRQLTPEPREFGLRMSNLGKPLCQLQNEQAGVPQGRMDYNHILRMMLGDMTEIAVNVLIKASGINVTKSKTKHIVDIDGTEVNGEDDIEINGKVYDIKSASPYSFSHKWTGEWNDVYYGDSFGYVAQLWAYANKDPDRMGGWIVVDKSSGEVRVVDAKPTKDQLEELAANVSATVHKIESKADFNRLFQPEVETYYKKETGNMVVPTICSFCPFMKKCWPDAKLEQRVGAKPKWYLGDKT